MLKRVIRWGFLALLISEPGCSRTPEPNQSRAETQPIPDDALIVATKGLYGGSLSYPLRGEPSTFNPAAARENRSILLAGLTAGFLMEFDPVQKRVLPGLARSWEFREDGRALHLQLRRDIYFSDGHPFGSRDVVWTLGKIFEEDSNNPHKGALEIEGEGWEVEAQSRETVTIKTPKPVAAIEFLLTTIPILPLHRFPETGGNIEDFWGLDTSPENMTGLGPFQIAENRPGQGLVLARNPHYWKVDSEGNRLPYLDSLEIEYWEDPNTQLLRFQSGELDILDRSLRADDFSYLSQGSANGLQLRNSGPSNELLFFWFNLRSEKGTEAGSTVAPSFRLRGFREAVSWAVDRKALAENVFQGMAHPARNLVPASNTPWFREIQEWPEDGEKMAREQLKSLGFQWKQSQGNSWLVDSTGEEVKFELITSSDPLMGKVAAFLRQDLQELGIQVRIQQEEFRALIGRLSGSGHYEAALMKMNLPFDPSEYQNMLLSSGPMHVWNPRQETPASQWEGQIDSAMNRLTALHSQEERAELFREVQAILQREVPVIPLVSSDALSAAHPHVKNFRPANLFPLALWNAWELYRD